MNIKPINDYVVIKRYTPEKKSEGGIIIPDEFIEQHSHGEVLAVGGGNKTVRGKRIPMEVSVGDYVVFREYAGSEVESEGNKYLMMKEKEIYCVI